MMFVKSDEKIENGALPTAEMVGVMAKYNEALADSGAMLAGDGFHASSKGARVAFHGGETTVTQGPFPNPTELVAGYWLIKVKSKEEAIEWAKKVPFQDGVIELRQVQELEDFPADVREAAGDEAAMRDKLQKNA